jgi:hypothetical protein
MVNAPRKASSYFAGSSLVVKHKAKKVRSHWGTESCAYYIRFLTCSILILAGMPCTNENSRPLFVSLESRYIWPEDELKAQSQIRTGEMTFSFGMLSYIMIYIICPIIILSPCFGMLL